MPKLPINYQNTIIYKIVCNDLKIQELYVGSTTDFNRRKNKHKSDCELLENNNFKYNTKIYKVMRENGGWNNWSMIKVEDYPCNSSQDAKMRERYYYEHLNANLNTYIPYQSAEERKQYKHDNDKLYREENEDTVKAKKREYRIKNKEKIAQHDKEYREANKELIRVKQHEKYLRYKSKNKSNLN